MPGQCTSVTGVVSSVSGAEDCTASETFWVALHRGRGSGSAAVLTVIPASAAETAAGVCAAAPAAADTVVLAAADVVVGAVVDAVVRATALAFLVVARPRRPLAPFRVCFARVDGERSLAVPRLPACGCCWDASLAAVAPAMAPRTVATEAAGLEELVVAAVSVAAAVPAVSARGSWSPLCPAPAFPSGLAAAAAVGSVLTVALLGDEATAACLEAASRRRSGAPLGKASPLFASGSLFFVPVAGLVFRECLSLSSRTKKSRKPP